MGNLTAIEIEKARETVRMIFGNSEFIIYSWQLIVIAAIALAYVLTVWLLMGFGLRKMAINRAMAHAWLGFIPFARYYLIGKLAGESRIFGKKIKNAGLIVLILSAATFAMNAFVEITNYYTVLKYFFEGKVVTITVAEGGYLEITGELISNGVTIASYVFAIISRIVGCALLFMLITLYLDFFKTYAPEHYLFYALLVTIVGEFLPIDGFFVFALRGKKAVRYYDYVKERYMRMQGTFTSPRPNPPDNPFREFGERGDNDPGDPFGGRFDGPDDRPADKPDEKENDKKDDDPFGEFKDDGKDK